MALADDLHHLARELHELHAHPARHSRDEITFWLAATSEFLRELSKYVDDQPGMRSMQEKFTRMSIDQPARSAWNAKSKAAPARPHRHVL